MSSKTNSFGSIEKTIKTKKKYHSSTVHNFKMPPNSFPTPINPRLLRMILDLLA